MRTRSRAIVIITVVAFAFFGLLLGAFALHSYSQAGAAASNGGFKRLVQPPVNHRHLTKEEVDAISARQRREAERLAREFNYTLG
jgi:hypothetical protein